MQKELDGYTAHMLSNTGLYVEDPCHKQWEADDKALKECYIKDAERFAVLSKREQHFELLMRYPKCQ